MYWDGYDSGETARRGNHMGDTEAGTRAWMATLKAALKNADPPPATYTIGTGAAAKSYTLAITVTDFSGDAAPPAPQPSQ